MEANREDVLNTTLQSSVVISIRVKLHLGEKKESVGGFINLPQSTLGDVKPGSDPSGWHTGSIAHSSKQIKSKLLLLAQTHQVPGAPRSSEASGRS